MTGSLISANYENNTLNLPPGMGGVDPSITGAARAADQIQHYGNVIAYSSLGGSVAGGLLGGGIAALFLLGSGPIGWGALAAIGISAYFGSKIGGFLGWGISSAVEDPKINRIQTNLANGYIDKQKRLQAEVMGMNERNRATNQGVYDNMAVPFMKEQSEILAGLEQYNANERTTSQWMNRSIAAPFIRSQRAILGALGASVNQQYSY